MNEPVMQIDSWKRNLMDTPHPPINTNKQLVESNTFALLFIPNKSCTTHSLHQLHKFRMQLHSCTTAKHCSLSNGGLKWLKCHLHSCAMAGRWGITVKLPQLHKLFPLLTHGIGQVWVGMGVALCSEEAWGLFWVKQQPLEAHGLCISTFDV